MLSITPKRDSISFIAAVVEAAQKSLPIKEEKGGGKFWAFDPQDEILSPIKVVFFPSVYPKVDTFFCNHDSHSI